SFFSFFFFNDTATTEIYTLSLHDALPIPDQAGWRAMANSRVPVLPTVAGPRSEEHTSELQSRQYLVCRLLLEKKKERECCSLWPWQGRTSRVALAGAPARGVGEGGQPLDLAFTLARVTYRAGCFFFLNDTATPEIYPLSLHDALPISSPHTSSGETWCMPISSHRRSSSAPRRSEEHTSELQSRQYLVCRPLLEKQNKSSMVIVVCVPTDSRSVCDT